MTSSRHRTQHVPVDADQSSTLVTNSGAPQGCVLLTVLFTAYTNDCRAEDDTCSNVKFADDAALVALIYSSDYSPYHQEVDALVQCCADIYFLEIRKQKSL